MSKRLEWLDAMRGFTMILVVTVHVSEMSFGIRLRDSSVQELVTLFRMPLFFFVSGFLSYKATTLWTRQTLGSSLLKKFRVQLIPTAVFLVCHTVFAYRKDVLIHLQDSLAGSMKGGYWFTWVLLQMFVVYYLFAFAEQWLLARKWGRRIPRWLPVCTLLLLAALLYESAYLPKVFTYPKSAWATASSFICFARFFCFFVLGNICRRYWTGAERLFDSRWLFPTMVLMAFVCSAEICHWHNLKGAWRNLPRTLDLLAILSIVLMTFRHYGHNVSRETRTGRILQHIGTRTLDVYLLHYFFLPTIPAVGVWFKHNHHNMVPELVLTIGVALIVIAFCCLTSAVLRTSGLLKKYLFGKE